MPHQDQLFPELQPRMVGINAYAVLAWIKCPPNSATWWWTWAMIIARQQPYAVDPQSDKVGQHRSVLIGLVAGARAPAPR